MFNFMDMSAEGLSPSLNFNQTPLFSHHPEDSFPDLLEMASDMETFLAMDQIEEVKEEDSSDLLPSIIQQVGIEASILPDETKAAATATSAAETTQSLIDEVERYLQTVSGESTKVDDEEEEVVNSSIEESWSLNTSSTSIKGEEAVDPEKIFQALTSGNVVEDLDLGRAITTSVVDPVAGENVFIIIAPPSPTTSEPLTVPAMTSFSSLSPGSIAASSPVSPGSDRLDSTSDYEWTPSPAQAPAVTSRRKYQRKNRPSPPSGPYPKEKGERKKAQNRTAAFRYREKKKAEQDAADGELNLLFEKNARLKRKLADMEVEVKCLKKLMLSTGLGHYLNSV